MNATKKSRKSAAPVTTEALAAAAPVAPAVQAPAAPAPKKTKCPVGRAQFLAKAPVIRVSITVGDTVLGSFIAPPREFSTGSFGWNLNNKLEALMVDGLACTAQLGMNLTVVGSKDSAP